MPRCVRLTADEIAALDEQEPFTANDGGYQGLLVKLQQQLDRNTNDLQLNDTDLDRIPRYAYDYRQGGWQDRLELIFGRTLGPGLRRNTPPTTLR